MREQKSIVLGALGVFFAFCAAFASATTGQQAWYNNAIDPEVDPPAAVMASITSPVNTIQFPCSEGQKAVVCTINGRQAHATNGLNTPLFRAF